MASARSPVASHTDRFRWWPHRSLRRYRWPGIRWSSRAGDRDRQARHLCQIALMVVHLDFNTVGRVSPFGIAQHVPAVNKSRSTAVYGRSFIERQQSLRICPSILGGQVKAESCRSPLVDIIATRTLGRMRIRGHSPRPAIDPLRSDKDLN